LFFALAIHPVKPELLGAGEGLTVFKREHQKAGPEPAAFL
jgi:hypothetical protein